MQTFDFSLLQTDLAELEEKLRQYGSKPVKDEISLNQLFIDHLASGGSRTRAILALAAGHSQSLDKSARLSIAASVELLHQASLIHDDVQDEDSTRRGKAAVWAVAGKSSAICLGDDLIGVRTSMPYWAWRSWMSCPQYHSLSATMRKSCSRRVRVRVAN